MTSINLALPDSVPDDRYRRRTGLALGALLGLTYGLVSQLGNRLAAPGVPLLQAPFGAAGNVVMYTLAGALLGALVAVPRSSIKGVFLMAAASVTGVMLLSLLSAPDLRSNFGLSVVTAFSLGLPFWALFVPVFAALRWVIDRQEEAHRDGRAAPGQVFRPLALAAVVAFAGYTAIYPPVGRETLQVAHAFLTQARSGAVPEALAEVEGFAAHRGSSYRLAWEAGDLNRFRIPRPGRNFINHSAVIARYAEGWHLVCIYITLDEPPRCQGFDVLPQ